MLKFRDWNSVQRPKWTASSRRLRFVLSIWNHCNSGSRLMCVMHALWETIYILPSFNAYKTLSLCFLKEEFTQGHPARRWQSRGSTPGQTNSRILHPNPLTSARICLAFLEASSPPFSFRKMPSSGGVTYHLAQPTHYSHVLSICISYSGN